MQAVVLKNPQNCRIDGRNIRHAVAGGDDHFHAGLFQPFPLFIGAEIGVDNIQIGQGGSFAFFRHGQSQIDRKFRFSASVVAGDDLDALH